MHPRRTGAGTCSLGGGSFGWMQNRILQTRDRENLSTTEEAPHALTDVTCSRVPRLVDACHRVSRSR